MTHNESDRNTAITLMHTRATHLMQGHYLSFEEYADNVTATLVDGPLEWLEECVAIVPANVVGKYAIYLQQRLEPLDFMPDPRCFNGPDTEEEVEQKKRELRPKYLRLYEVVTDRASSMK